MYASSKSKKAAVTTLTLTGVALSVLIFTLWRGSWSSVADEQRQRPLGVDLELHVQEFTKDFSERGPYRVPEPAERRTVAAGVGLLLDGRWDDATARLSEVDLTLRTLTDRVSGRTYAEISERREGSDGRGWGRVYLDTSGAARWSVQVPHPVADLETERLGVGVLRSTAGGVMVLAGAHRNAGEGDSADVAHRQDSVFHTVTGELVKRQLPGMQLHGYANDTLPDHDTVVSTGYGTHGRTEAEALAEALTADAFDVCRAWEAECVLEGRSNEQGRQAHRRELPFLHLEFNADVRQDAERAAEAVRAMGTITDRWSE